MKEICDHIRNIRELKRTTDQVCEECIQTNSSWVHLRICQACGITFCCDDSPNKHMTKHNQKTNHPVVISAEPREQWMGCYEDEQFVKY